VTGWERYALLRCDLMALSLSMHAQASFDEQAGNYHAAEQTREWIAQIKTMLQSTQTETQRKTQ